MVVCESSPRCANLVCEILEIWAGSPVESEDIGGDGRGLRKEGGK